MGHRFGKLTRAGKVFLVVVAVLIVGVVVGLLLPGRQGNAIAIVSAALLAFLVVCIVGLPNGMMDRRGPYDPFER